MFFRCKIKFLVNGYFSQTDGAFPSFFFFIFSYFFLNVHLQHFTFSVFLPNYIQLVKVNTHAGVFQIQRLREWCQIWHFSLDIVFLFWEILKMLLFFCVLLGSNEIAKNIFVVVSVHHYRRLLNYNNLLFWEHRNMKWFHSNYCSYTKLATLLLINLWALKKHYEVFPLFHFDLI